MDEPGTWARRTDVLWRRSGEALLLMVPGSPDIIALDRSGLELWEELARPATLHGLSSTFAARYGAPPTQVADDLAPVLEDLERKHAVRRCA